ncbi:MAG: methyltransferase domain-containing protein [Gammaproteobacteria bacterium]|nr:methyltransferase domain-containing protein [Gammaproteobacteria bacterium]
MSSNDDGVVLEKNAKVADMWSSGGRAYDEVSRGISEGIRHCVMRLAPQNDERVLDIATGTGLTARHISRSGANVTGVDIAQGLLDAASQLADEEGLSINWQLGDAEKLPFTDASFDAAASTFGIMFASNQEAAISELARVVRPGGRIAIAAWLPESTAVKLRQVVARFMPSPPQQASPPPSPFNWGDAAWLQDALGPFFQLGHENGELTHRVASPEDAWRVYEDGFGPIRATAQALDPERRSDLKSAFESWISGFSTDLGVALTYQYILTVGVRK